MQNSSESCSQTNDEETKCDKFVEFCVNIDIGSWKPQIEQLSKVPDPFMPLGSQDMLNFSQVDVLGLTTPQTYLKVKGNWTGGHQENLRVRAANINHGP